MWRLPFFAAKHLGAPDLHDLTNLKQALTPLLSSQRCLIIGAAPQYKLVPHDRVVCVNASGWSAKRMGIEKPDLTVMSAFTLKGKTSVQMSSIAALSGLSTRTLLLVDHKISVAAARKVLIDVGYLFDQLLTISPLNRAEIFNQVCREPVPSGDHNARPSTGMFAAAISIWAGAESTALTGFSFCGGHAYMTGDTPRQHIEGDKWFLARTEQYGVAVA